MLSVETTHILIRQGLFRGWCSLPNRTTKFLKKAPTSVRCFAWSDTINTDILRWHIFRCSPDFHIKYGFEYRTIAYLMTPCVNCRAAQFTKDEVRDNPNRLPYPRDDYNKMKDRRPLRPHVPGKSMSFSINMFGLQTTRLCPLSTGLTT
jgi:hypothetical protein